jgi:methylated-DNA-[protein]-cysteine S-methyltransferase
MRSAVDQRIARYLEAVFVEKDDQVLKDTRRQLEEYFSYRRKQFDIPLLMAGTDFQKRVWSELGTIRYGTTSSYRELAERIGNKKAVRAVATANGANALSILIPCHRIIGSSGDLVGYAGGLNTKKKLLLLEQNLFGI